MTTRPEASRTTLFGNFWLRTFAPALLCATASIAMPSSQAQTLRVLYPLSDTPAGVNSYGGVTLDAAGNLYGMMGVGSDGSVWELKHELSSWIFQPLYYFKPQDDGRNPEDTVVFGPDGALYGTTYAGGYSCFVGSHECGTVFSVRSSPNPCGSAICLWNETRVHWFGGLGSFFDGSFPGYGRLIFDSAGNIYGTTEDGGSYGQGAVFELVNTGNGWTEHVLYSFRGNTEPQNPFSGLTFASAGNLYGTTYLGGTNHAGTAFELIHSGQGWTEKTLYSFGGSNDGGNPIGGLVFDAAGNAYGSTEGRNGGLQSGTVFQLSPQADGSWHETVLYVLDGLYGPWGDLVMDAAGNLYGTTPGTSASNYDHFGMVFKLSVVDGSWTFTRLYEFTGGADGAFSYGGATLDAAGNLYGTCIGGGANGLGTIWELTP
jgi:uncharacterized repeat protein (TIGR03803 family)